jgi:hypothetical protein
MQLCDTTTLTNAEQLMSTSSHILSKIVRFSGRTQWSFITACKTFYEWYQLLVTRIATSSNNMPPLTYECTKVLQCCAGLENSWGPFQFIAISNLEEPSIQGSPMNIAYLRGVDLFNDFYKLKFIQSLTSLTLRDVFFPALEKILPILASLECLYIENCYGKFNFDLSKDCKSLKELYLTHFFIDMSEFELSIPQNLEKLVLKGECEDTPQIVINANHYIAFTHL